MSGPASVLECRFRTIEKRPAFDQVFDGRLSGTLQVDRKIPASWENTGNFARWALRAQANASNSSAISTRYSAIPCASEQGIFCSLKIAPSGNRQGLAKSRFCQVLSGSKGERQSTDVNLYIFSPFFIRFTDCKYLHIPPHATNMYYAEVFEERRGRQACGSRQPEVGATQSTHLKSAAANNFGIRQGKI
jgi:hypothetical protein